MGKDLYYEVTEYDDSQMRQAQKLLKLSAEERLKHNDGAVASLHDLENYRAAR